MPLEHELITDPDIHEPKGISSAANGRVYVANGAGSGSWDKLIGTSISSGGADNGAQLEADGLGGASFQSRIIRLTANIGTPVSVAANTTAEQTLNFAGLILANHNILRVIKPTHQAGLIIASARVAADNQISITYGNLTGTPIVPTASETYVVYVYRY